MGRGSRDEQECAQASSYDREFFDNLASQVTGHRPGRGGKAPIHRWKRAVFPPLSNLKGRLKAHKALKAHTPPRRNRVQCVTQILVYERGLSAGNFWRDARDFGRPTASHVPWTGAPGSPRRTGPKTTGEAHQTIPLYRTAGKDLRKNFPLNK